jgi:hypothetical protein
MTAKRSDGDRSEGDINLSPARAAWTAAHIDAGTQALLDADAEVFLHQALSIPAAGGAGRCRRRHRRADALDHGLGIELDDPARAPDTDKDRPWFRHLYTT